MEEEPKKKRRKMKKESGTPSAEASAQVLDAEDGRALFSGAEDEKPMKKVPSLSSFKILAYGTYGGRSHQSAWGDEETRYVRRAKRKSPRRPHRAKSNSEGVRARSGGNPMQVTYQCIHQRARVSACACSSGVPDVIAAIAQPCWRAVTTYTVYQTAYY